MRYFESRHRDIQSKHCNALLANCVSENKTILYAQYKTYDKITRTPCSIAEYGRFFVKEDQEYNELMKDEKLPKAYLLIFDESQWCD